MHELKKVHNDAIPKALDRAMRYRLLNEPFQAESICRDILAVSADNEDAHAVTEESRQAAIRFGLQELGDLGKATIDATSPQELRLIAGALLDVRETARFSSTLPGAGASTLTVVAL